MWTDYWSTLLSHWVEKEFDALGYPTSEELDNTDRTEAEVHLLTEVTTNCKALFHWQGYASRQNILIPNEGLLYKFLKEKPHRIANCVFLSMHKDGDTTLFQVINYGERHITNEYIAFENAKTQKIDNLEGCSLTHQNGEDFDTFLKKPIDAWKRVLEMFSLGELFK